MKRIAIITPFCFFLFAGITASAQKTEAEAKPVKHGSQVDTQKPASSVSPAFQPATQQAAPPIVPGGEFKPTDTRVHPLSNAVEPKPAIPPMPVNKPVSAVKSEEKKAASTPVRQQ